MKIKKFLTIMLSACLLLTFVGCGEGKNDAPQNVALTYTPATAVANMAKGTLSFEINTEPENLYEYNIMWGNDKGCLENYTPLGTVKLKSIKTSKTFNIPDVAIPEEATRIYAIGCTRTKEQLDSSFVNIPANHKQASEKLYEFQVLSDHQLQSTDKTHDFNLKTMSAYQDIKATSPNTTMIIQNGDLVEFDDAKYYKKFFEIVHSVYGETLPAMYFTVGNHEFIHRGKSPVPSDFNTAKNTWNLYTSEYNGTSDVYFYKIINGSYFIFLGSIESPISRDGLGIVDATLGEEQINWLENLLVEAEKTGKPVYTFLHQSLRDTVSGSLTEDFQDWYGLSEEEDSRLRTMFDKYPNLLHFTAHSHWNLESKGNWLNGNGKTASYFNSASVGYLWQGVGGGEPAPGSEGLYVEVYKDYVRVRGRRFTKKLNLNKWISAAQFIVPLTAN